MGHKHRSVHEPTKESPYIHFRTRAKVRSKGHAATNVEELLKSM